MHVPFRVLWLFLRVSPPRPYRLGFHCNWRYSGRPGVAGAIVGTRLGLNDHSEDNKRVFALRLDDEDRSRLVSFQETLKKFGFVWFRFVWFRFVSFLVVLFRLFSLSLVFVRFGAFFFCWFLYFSFLFVSFRVVSFHFVWFPFLSFLFISYRSFSFVSIFPFISFHLFSLNFLWASRYICILFFLVCAG